MARRKQWFLSRLWRYLPRPDARRMFQEMGLAGEETEVLIKRFWDGLPIKSVGARSGAEQRRTLPVWDLWAERWCREHRERFSEKEQAALGLSGLANETRTG